MSTYSPVRWLIGPIERAARIARFSPKGLVVAADLRRMPTKPPPLDTDVTIPLSRDAYERARREDLPEVPRGEPPTEPLDEAPTIPMRRVF